MARAINHLTPLAGGMLMSLVISGTVLGATSIPQGSDWSSVERLPDWSGVWQATEFQKHVYEGGVLPWKDLGIPFTPEAATKFEDLKNVSLGRGNIPTRADRCMSLGVPGDMNSSHTRFQWIFTPGQITIVGSELLRRIYTDGRAHFTDIDTFQGDSIGHWEKGGILVVDTVALDPENEFIPGFRQGANSHVVERFHLQNHNLLVADVTLTAPEVLAKSWVYQLTFIRDKRPLTEFDCAPMAGL